MREGYVDFIGGVYETNAQGDIVITLLPDDFEIATAHEIKPANGILIVQEGEATGHHHHIPVRHFRPSQVAVDPVLNIRDHKLGRMFGARTEEEKEEETSTCRLYVDNSAMQRLQQDNLLTRTDLVVGFLVVEGQPVTLKHQEHDGIRLPAGKYYIGRQIESAGAEERMVTD